MAYQKSTAHQVAIVIWIAALTIIVALLWPRFAAAEVDACSTFEEGLDRVLDAIHEPDGKTASAIFVKLTPAQTIVYFDHLDISAAEREGVGTVAFTVFSFNTSVAFLAMYSPEGCFTTAGVIASAGLVPLLNELTGHTLTWETVPSGQDI